MSVELKTKIEQLLEPLLEDGKFFIVEIKVSVSKVHSKVSILLDSDEGIKIDECSAISRAIGQELDELMPEKYTLEVSSPGVGYPLKSERMFQKNVGRQLQLKLNQGGELKGELTEVSGEGIQIIEIKKRKKNEEIIPVALSYNDIKEAIVMVSFK